jgi:hypothetical protein
MQLPVTSVPTTANCIEARTIPRTREAMMPEAIPAVERARLASGAAGVTGEVGATGEPGAKGDPGRMGETGGRDGDAGESLLMDSVIEGRLLRVRSRASG